MVAPLRHLPFLIFTAVLVTGAASGPAEESGPADAVERLEFTEKDLPKDERYPDGVSEIDDFARGRGLNYARVVRQAARGDAKALKQFFAMSEDVDGAAAESYSGTPTAVYHILGDEKFARFLNAQPLAFRVMVRNRIVGDGMPAPARVYLPRHFPETAKTLFNREVVDWVSPDKRYAIRKVFSDAFDLRGSKVERAELIEQKSGSVLCDLSADDIGIGGHREGKVLWSPDSKRFAYMSSDLTVHEGNLFSTPRPPPQRKQTVIYQVADGSCTRLDVPLKEPAGRENDLELKKAILGHEFTEPIRWEKPNVLILQRHDYYETLKPIEVGGSKFESIHQLGRLYRVTAKFAPDGKSEVAWKLQDF